MHVANALNRINDGVLPSGLTVCTVVTLTKLPLHVLGDSQIEIFGQPAAE